jgi:hypothetical protein
MNSDTYVRPEESLRNVKCEIRGRLARRAHELERLGYEMICLNIGNPGAFGFSTSQSMRLAIIENLAAGEGYCHQQGIFPARAAVVIQQPVLAQRHVRVAPGVSSNAPVARIFALRTGRKRRCCVGCSRAGKELLWDHAAAAAAESGWP